MTAPIEVTLSIDLDKHLARFVRYDLDGEPIEHAATVEDVVIEAAARQFIASLDGDLRVETHRRIREIRDELIRDQIAPQIEEAVSRSVQPTDHLGNPKGEPMTMAEVIVQTATAALTKKGDRYSATNGRSLVEQFIHEHVTTAFTKELKQAVDTAKAEVLAAVKEKGGEVLAQTIASMAGVR